MSLEARTSAENQQARPDIAKQQLQTDLQTYADTLTDKPKATLVTALAPQIIALLAVDGKYDLWQLQRQKVLQAFFEPANTQLLTAMQTNLQSWNTKREQMIGWIKSSIDNAYTIENQEKEKETLRVAREAQTALTTKYNIIPPTPAEQTTIVSSLHLPNVSTVADLEATFHDPQNPKFAPYAEAWMSVSDFLSFLHTKDQLATQPNAPTTDPDVVAFQNSLATIQADLWLYERSTIPFKPPSEAVPVAEMHNLSDAQISQITTENPQSGRLQEFAGDGESELAIATWTSETLAIDTADTIETQAHDTLCTFTDDDTNATSLGIIGTGRSLTPADVLQARTLVAEADTYRTRFAPAIRDAHLPLPAGMPAIPDTLTALPDTTKAQMGLLLKNRYDTLSPTEKANNLPDLQALHATIGEYKNVLHEKTVETRHALSPPQKKVFYKDVGATPTIIQHLKF